MGSAKQTAYVLKNIDPELWKHFKMKAIDNNMSIKTALLTMVQMYVDGSLEIGKS